MTEKIIGCAYKVHNKMGYGFLESVYEKCLMIEWKRAGLNSEAQKSITVFNDDEVVGDFKEVQLINYLTATKMDIGLLLNFAIGKVER